MHVMNEKIGLRARRQTRFAQLMVLAALAGCTGGIDDDERRPGGRTGSGAGGGTGATGGTAAGDGGAGGVTSDDCTPWATLPRRIWLLSNQQYANAVRDVLGLPAGPAVSGGGASLYAFVNKDELA